MKKVIFVIMALALIAMALPSCAAKGVSQEEYDELKHQLTVIEGKIDALEGQLSDIRQELEAARTQVAQEPVGGQKLVGQGAYGVFPPEEDGTYLEGAGSFTVTNPDCVSEITIDRVSIFDMDGTVVYEGDLFTVDWEGGELVPTYCTEPLKPHEQRWIEVDSTMCYLRDQGKWSGDHIFFTVEIFWSWTDQKGLPLIGWAGSRILKRDAEGNIIEFQSGGTTQMVNMEQELKPEKPK